MNFQEKLFETTADLRSRAQAFANTAYDNACAQAGVAAKRIEKLKGSLKVLNAAGREFDKVARRHATRFVKQNSTIASEVRDDVTALARSTFANLTRKPATSKARKASPARKRAARKAN